MALKKFKALLYLMTFSVDEAVFPMVLPWFTHAATFSQQLLGLASPRWSHMCGARMTRRLNLTLSLSTISQQHIFWLESLQMASVLKDSNRVNTQGSSRLGLKLSQGHFYYVLLGMKVTRSSKFKGKGKYRVNLWMRGLACAYKEERNCWLAIFKEKLTQNLL